MVCPRSSKSAQPLKSTVQKLQQGHMKLGRQSRGKAQREIAATVGVWPAEGRSLSNAHFLPHFSQNESSECFIFNQENV